MNVGVIKEIKKDEYRVGLTPAGTRELVANGHDVFVQAGAGEGSLIADDEYAAQGAKIVPDMGAAHEVAEMIVGVKEPQPAQVPFLGSHHTLFTYLHLAPEPELTRRLMASGATCIAYETVEDSRGCLPLLSPMSEIAGKIATQAGAFILERPIGGRGVLLGGTAGVAKATVAVIGGGIVGTHAALIAIGMGAEVFIFERDVDRMRELELLFDRRANTVFSSALAIEEMLPRADMIIGAVLVPGAKAPHVVSRDQLSLMKERAVLVDVSIDQGGCFETSRPTTHSDPTFDVGGVTHYCVANMPGAVPITSTWALTNSTLPYMVDIANKGAARAAEDNSGLIPGFNVVDGKVTNGPVANDLGHEYHDPRPLLGI